MVNHLHLLQEAVDAFWRIAAILERDGPGDAREAFVIALAMANKISPMDLRSQDATSR